MNVDVHAHIMARSFYGPLGLMSGIHATVHTAYDRSDDALPLQDAWFEPDHQLRDMDRKGIDMRLVSLSIPGIYVFRREDQPDLAKRVNDEAIALACRHPDRIKVLASLPLGDVEASLEELERMAGSHEVAGLTIGSNVNGVSLSDQRFEPLWARINALRMPVVEHPMHNPPISGELRDMNLSTAIGYMFDTQLMVSRLIMYGIFERFPDFPFVAAHTGGGLFNVLGRMDRIAARQAICKERMKKPFSEYAKKLYYDSCSFYAPALMQAHQMLDSGHMMFGTDYPYVDSDDRHVMSLDIPETDKKAIMGGAAARVFGLAAQETRPANPIA